MKTYSTQLLVIALDLAALIPLTAVAQNQPRYSRSELKQLVRDAHTREQYQALATYFRSQEKIFNDKAVIEKTEWDRRKATVTGPEIKSRCVESARNLYQYYAYEACAMATRASDYEQRSK